MSTTKIIILTAAISVIATAAVSYFLYSIALQRRAEADGIEKETAAMIGLFDDAAQQN